MKVTHGRFSVLDKAVVSSYTHTPLIVLNNKNCREKGMNKGGPTLRIRITNHEPMNQ